MKISENEIKNIIDGIFKFYLYEEDFDDEADYKEHERLYEKFFRPALEKAKDEYLKPKTPKAKDKK